MHGAAARTAFQYIKQEMKKLAFKKIIHSIAGCETFSSSSEHACTHPSRSSSDHKNSTLRLTLPNKESVRSYFFPNSRVLFWEACFFIKALISSSLV